MRNIVQEPFRAPWWCHGPHPQTIWRRLFEKPARLPLEPVRWETPDGDFIDFDFLKPESFNLKTPVILILHGLEGSSRSKYALGLLRACFQKEWLGIAMNFRSCSGELNRLVRSYHSGETGDLNWAVEKLLNLYPGHPIGIAGYSLGGNVLLKWLGENGSRLSHSIIGGAAISVPYDLKISASLIDSAGFNRSVYAHTFLKTLKEKFIRKIEVFNLNYSPKEIQKINTFRQFDDLVTAPIHGFENADDYWNRSSAIHYLEKIRKPVYLLHSEDDPFLSEKVFRFNRIKKSDYLTKELTKEGGHVGFVAGKWPWHASYLPENRIVHFFDKKINPER
jgi:predicted alpha/beta-fold hydrolase